MLERGRSFHEAERWNRAISVLSEFTMSYPFHDEIAEASFLLAESYYKGGQFDLAAIEYRRIAQRFPDSEFAERAELMVAESYFSASPRTDLDQSKTELALSYFRDFVTYHPRSEFVAQAEDGIRRCREKLAKKEYDVLRSYYRLGQYESVVLLAELIEEEFGGTSYVHKTQLLKAMAYLEIPDEAEKAKPILMALVEDSDDEDVLKDARKLLGKIE